MTPPARRWLDLLTADPAGGQLPVIVTNLACGALLAARGRRSRDDHPRTHQGAGDGAADDGGLDGLSEREVPELVARIFSDHYMPP